MERESWQRLAGAFPAANVLALGVSDEPGEGMLMTAEGADHLTSLNPAWTTIVEEVSWREGETVGLTRSTS